MPEKPSPQYAYRDIKRALTDEQIIAAYQAGEDADAVAFRAHIHPATVRKILLDSGVALRPPQRGRRSVHERPRIPEEEICRRYLAGESGPQLAKASGISQSRIYGVLTRHNIPRRDSRQLMQARHRAQRQRREAQDG